MDAEKARTLLKQAQTYWSDIYKEAEDDLRFSIGQDHWSETDIINRAGRPCLVINQLPQFIHQTANDMRQNTPHINVIPGDNEADVKTAEVFKGMVKYIEYRSGADAVYDTGGENAVRSSLGFMKVDHDYVNDTGLEQELLIKGVPNVLSTWIDPSSIEPDGCDSNWAISLETVTKDDFDQRYKDRKFVSFEGTEGQGEQKADEVINVAELYIKEFQSSKKIVDENGNEAAKETDKTRSRDIRTVVIKRYKFNGEDKPLEQTTFPGKYIPVVPVYGEVVWIKGKRYILSLIRQSKDAQRRLNHWASKETEILSMAPTAPIMAPVGSTNDFEEWNDPGNATVLPYRMTNDSGEKLDKPERLQPPSIPTGIINAMQGAKENIKETMGLYNSSLGQKSNETSGVAIDARDQQASTGTLHFSDNLKRSVQHLGRIVVGAIPFFYDTPRVIHIVGDEEETKPIAINGAPLQEGQEQAYDLKKGQYDVRIITGASYATKREEAANFMGDLVKVDPKLLGVFGDLLFKNMDVAGAQAVAERIRKTIPAQLLDDDKNTDPMVQQLKMENQALQAQMQQMGTELQSKQADEQSKLQDSQTKAKAEHDKAAHEAVRLQFDYMVEENKNKYEMGKLALENKKLEMETADRAKKLSIEEQRVQDGSFGDDGQEQELKEREMRLKEMEFALKAAQARAEVIKSQQPERDSDEQPIQPAQPNPELVAIQQTIEHLIAAIGQPITILRDENGAIVGAQ